MKLPEEQKKAIEQEAEELWPERLFPSGAQRRAYAHGATTRAIICQQKDDEIGELKSKLRGDKPLSEYVTDYKEANGIKQWLGGETKWDLQKVNSMNSHEQLTALQGYQNIIRDLDAMFYAVEEGISSKDEEIEGLKDALSCSESIADGLEKSKQLLDDEIARLRSVLEWYADPGNYLDENSDLATAWKMNENIANKAKEALKK